MKDTTSRAVTMVEVLEREALESSFNSLCDLFYKERSASTTPAIKISRSIRHGRRFNPSQAIYAP
jgi:hypothetical protein